MRKSDVVKNAAALLLGALIAALAVGLPFIPVSAAQGGQIVVIDAGHGGSDAGVRGVRSGVKESELNLIVAKLLGEYLEGEGVRVVYTRTADVMRGYPGVASGKRADMYRRRDVILKAEPQAVISIHMNYYTSSTRRGAQVFYDKGSEGGRALAEALQAALNRDINSSEGGREYGALTAEKFLLECSPYPTAIAECGFLSNPIDEANLLSEEYRLRLVKTLAGAILCFLRERAQGA